MEYGKHWLTTLKILSNFQTTLVTHILLLIISQVKSDSPPTPPSVSSELEIRSYNERDQNLSSFQIFKSKIKVLTKNRQFLIALLVFGSLQSSVNVFLSKVKIIFYLTHSITPLCLHWFFIIISIMFCFVLLQLHRWNSFCA